MPLYTVTERIPVEQVFKIIVEANSEEEAIKKSIDLDDWEEEPIEQHELYGTVEPSAELTEDAN